MSEHERLERLLKEAADPVRVEPAITPKVRRRVRRSQAGFMGLATASILAVSAGVVVMSQPSPLPLTGEEGPTSVEKVRPLASGSEGGTEWQMAVHESTTGAENVCIVVEKKQTCLDLEDHEGADVAVQYLRGLDRVLILVRTIGVDDVSLREMEGTSWAALFASLGGSDQTSYWYRFLGGHDVAGILSIGYLDLQFSAKVRWPNVSTSVGVAEDEYPELAKFPGSKEYLSTGIEGGGYSVFRRQTDAEVCLHLEGEFRCRAIQAPVEPIRLWVAKVLPCEPADDCGTGVDIVVIAGQVGPGVKVVGIRDSSGTSYVQVGGPAGTGNFLTTYYGNSGDIVELVALDDSEQELDVVEITFP